MTGRSLDGRVALVTGGGRGIGLAIARALAERGARVVVADSGTGIDGRGTDSAVAERAAAEVGGAAFPRNIAEPGAAVDAVAAAVARFGGLDILVNAAAILRDALVFKADPADWDAVIRTNLSAAFYTTAAATPVMRERAKQGDDRRGRIVNIVSTAGFYGNFGQAAYAAAKAGLMGLTRVTAMDMARSGVTCNAVAPFGATRVTESIRPANPAQESYKARALTIEARHVGGFVAWLCGDEAQSVSGQLFAVRGREAFLFSQARPVARIVDDGRWDGAALATAVAETFAPAFTPLETDLEAFDTEPVL